MLTNHNTGLSTSITIRIKLTVIGVPFGRNKQERGVIASLASNVRVVTLLRTGRRLSQVGVKLVPECLLWLIGSIAADSTSGVCIPASLGASRSLCSKIGITMPRSGNYGTVRVVATSTGDVILISVIGASRRFGLVPTLIVAERSELLAIGQAASFTIGIRFPSALGAGGRFRENVGHLVTERRNIGFRRALAS